MPTERRSTRSGKSDNNPPSDSGKGRTNSASSGSKKAAPARPASSRSKSNSKSEGVSQSKKMSGDKSQPNGTDPKQKGDDIEMNDDVSKAQSSSKGKDKDGDEEMTVVVPPSKKTPSIPNKDGEAGKDTDGKAPVEPEVDPKEKAINGISQFAQAFGTVANYLSQKSRPTLLFSNALSTNSTRVSISESFDPSHLSDHSLLPMSSHK